MRTPRALSDAGQAGVIRECLIKGIAQVPAVGEVERGGLDQVALRADPLKEHQELELEKDHWVNAWPTTIGVQLPCPIPNEAQIELGLQVAIEVIGRDQLLERDGNRFIEATGLCGAEHSELRGEGRVALIVALPLRRGRRIDRPVLEIAVERRARDPQSGTDRVDIGLPAVVQGPCQLQLLGISELLRPAT
jgi:hypothetical protein